MGLEALLTQLESRIVTPAPSAVTPDVTAKPLQLKDCTAVTPVTAVKVKDSLSAAIKGLPGDWAEALAELQAMQQPTDMMSERWVQLQTDATRFAELWGDFALSLGWRPDMAYAVPGGLVPFIDGDDILAICECSAVVRSIDRRQTNVWRYDQLTGEPAASWRCWSSWNDPPNLK